MFDALDTSASGLYAQRIRLSTIAANLANSQTTRDAAGKANPYRRRFVVFAPGGADGSAEGVHVAGVSEDRSPFVMKHDPTHPDAIPTGPQKGFVRYPNVHMMNEVVDALEATRAYEANVTAMENTKAMVHSTLRILA